MLIKCAECNNKISSKAKDCPQCGAPAPDWVDRISETVWSILNIIPWDNFAWGDVVFFHEKYSRNNR